MMALLGDALWRFYQLTGDKRSVALIDAFGDFVFNYGLFYGDKQVKTLSYLSILFLLIMQSKKS
ncbi:hypothetical protein CPS_4993 [Colwellia psychrerythraea 34H]|uniref:Uncharacterized protein n=1 Tax=Colwellia psychrerythraea (strain 34H / ATCC BAA-681) TaxID=167879 RepID=Q47U91_COLP3|nr:hypothetical protein CPS_4993 [Colwellia psychrerythraea 34H]